MSGESRHSFRKGATLQNLKMTQNNFGHVTTSNTDENQDDQVEFTLDPTHGITAMVKRDIFNSPAMLKFMENSGVSLDSEVDDMNDEDENLAAENITPPIPLAKLDIETLELFDSIIKSDPTHNKNNEPKIVEPSPIEHKLAEQECESADSFKVCINSVCKASLPEKAKFCNTCGFQQLAKFCHSCGHEFNMNDKFCLECGTKRKT